MAYTTYSISETVQRLSSDPLREIDLHNKQYTDKDLAELVDCLLLHLNVVTVIDLSYNRLTDETGVKLARYLATSSTIGGLYLTDNNFGEATYLAMAAALCINTSLRIICLDDNSLVEKSRVSAAFVDALILNPNRPIHSEWYLYSWDRNEFDRLKRTAQELGHPSMQASLALLTIIPLIDHQLIDHSIY